MDTNSTNNNEAGMLPEVRARVPEWLKVAVSEEASSRMLKEPDIVREALVKFLKRRMKRAVQSAPEAGKELAA